MSLIIVTGSNLGDKVAYLQEAKEELSQLFQFKAESRIYTSKAIEYLEQDDFYNQALEFSLPQDLNPDQTMLKLLSIEKEIGRDRTIPKGPRTIDIDIIFWGTQSFSTDYVNIPHPSCFERSFVMLPVQELPFFQTLQKKFKIPNTYPNQAKPI